MQHAAPVLEVHEQIRQRAEVLVLHRQARLKPRDLRGEDLEVVQAAEQVLVFPEPGDGRGCARDAGGARDLERVPKLLAAMRTSCSASGA